QPRDQRSRTSSRLMLTLWCILEMLVVKSKRFIVVIYGWHIWVIEQFCHNADFIAHFGLKFSFDIANPSPLPFVLVFPITWIPCTWFTLDVIKPGVFHAFATSPNVFTGD